MTKKKKLLYVLGTRPEFIKMYPLIYRSNNEFKEYFDSVVCTTGQHEKMLKDLLSVMPCKFDYDLNIMKPNQTLNDIVGAVSSILPKVIHETKPDLVLVQGDTSSAMITALLAANLQIPVAHIEAGLRTYDRNNPFPEENNRRIISQVATLHFAATLTNSTNLKKEGIEKNVFVVGNTVIDALKMILQDIESKRDLLLDNFKKIIGINISESQNVLITIHRRESFGEKLNTICKTIKDLAANHTELNFIIPVHENPNVKKTVFELLSGCKNIFLISPQKYTNFIFLFKYAILLLSDSGGVQEEATFLKKPVLILRECTERPEAVEKGINKLVGSDPKEIKKQFENMIYNADHIIDDDVCSIYGKGDSSLKILNIIKEYIN